MRPRWFRVFAPGKFRPGPWAGFPLGGSCPGRSRSFRPFCPVLAGVVQPWAPPGLRRRSGRKRPLPLDAFPPFTRSPLFSHRVVWRRSPDRFQPFLAFHALGPGSGPDRETRCCGPLRSSNGGARAVARPFRGPLEGVPDRWSGRRAPGGAVSPVSPRVGRAVSCCAAGQPHRPRSAATGAGRRRSGE